VAGNKRVPVIVTSAGAAAALAVGGVVQLARSGGDDVVRTVGRAGDDFARTAGDDFARTAGDDFARTGDDLARSAGDDSARTGDDLTRSVGDDSARSGEDIARDAAEGAACDVLYIAITERRLPTAPEWDEIVQEVSIDIVNSGESGVWQLVDQMTTEVSEVITDDGFVDEEEAESLADEFACS
jgi:hypothetical protein